MSSYFSEEQRLLKSTIGKTAIGIMILVAVLPFIILLLNLENTDGKAEVWWVLGSIMLFMAIISFIIARSKLKVTIDRTGIRYSYTPYIRKERQ